MTVKSSRPLFLIVSLSVTLIVLFIGLPTIKRKGFDSATLKFPENIEQFNSFTAAGDAAYTLEVPAGYEKQQLFIGKNLANVELLAEAAKTFLKFADKNSLSEENESYKTFEDKRNKKSKNPGLFILNKSGELSYKAKSNKKIAKLAQFSEHYYEDITLFQQISREANKITKLSEDKKNLNIDLPALLRLKLEPEVVSVVFLKTSGKKKKGEPYPVASEITIFTEPVRQELLAGVTATPTSTATPTPTPTKTPGADSGTATPTPSPTPSNTPTGTPTGTPTTTATSSTSGETATRTPTPAPTKTPTPVPSKTPTLKPTAIPTVAATATKTGSSGSAQSTASSVSVRSSASSVASSTSKPSSASSFSSFLSSIASFSSVTSVYSSTSTSKSSSSSSSSSSTSSFVSSFFSSSAPSKCFLCIYDSSDPLLKLECENKARNARRSGMSPVTVISDLESIMDQKSLCECDNIVVLRAVHGAPGEEEIPFALAEEIVEVAPGCSTLDISDMGCSRFDSSTEAVAQAKSLAKQLASSGYTGSVTVTGNQTLTLALNAQAESNPILIRIVGILNGISPVKIDEAIENTKKYCEANNTPIQFQVCASGVQIALYPCKTEGSTSKIDRDNNGSRTIVCESGGKRANQSCSYVTNTACDCDSRECQYCQCRWAKPSICG